MSAVDDFGAQPGVYVFADDGDTDEEVKDNGGSGAASGSKEAPLDFARDSSSPPSPPRTLIHRNSKSPSSLAKKSQVQDLRLRPDPYTPNDQDALDPRTPPVRTEAETQASLVNLPIVWKKLRSDVQQVMLSGLDYQDTFDLVSGDNMVHSRFNPRLLTVMLARIMYWLKLDVTPWSKYVPSWHYKRAESYLERLDHAPDRWPTLKKVRLDAEAKVMEALYADVSEDDETRDVRVGPGRKYSKTSNHSTSEYQASPELDFVCFGCTVNRPP